MKVRLTPLLIPFTVAAIIPMLLGLWFGTAPLAVPVPLRYATGVAVSTIGIWAVADSVFRVYLAQDTPLGDRPPKYLVREGSYRIVRNPMTLGMTLLLLSESFLFGSAAIAVWSALVLTISYVTTIKIEVPNLLKAFPLEYPAYARRTPGWMPRPSLWFRESEEP
jgi:protein-S-isoprenylcysteine O-methyltransferase Ste14